MPEFPELWYRGNFSVRRDIDFADAFLSVEYPGGFREVAVVGPTTGRRTWSLRYEALTNGLISPPGEQPQTRLDYIWNFFNSRKREGDADFIIVDPQEDKRFLCHFPNHRLSLEMVHHKLSTTGLEIAQSFRRDVNTLDDGSLGDATNPDVI